MERVSRIDAHVSLISSAAGAIHCWVLFSIHSTACADIHLTLFMGESALCVWLQVQQQQEALWLVGWHSCSYRATVLWSICRLVVLVVCSAVCPPCSFDVYLFWITLIFLDTKRKKKIEMATWVIASSGPCWRLNKAERNVTLKTRLTMVAEFWARCV